MKVIARAAAVVFIASFCTLVIEIVAGRLMAPYVGVSLYTWTSIIGVVLAGISAGAWAGGVLADRRPVESTLGWLLLGSGAAALLIAPLTDLLASDAGLLDDLVIGDTLLTRVVILAFLLFFLPSFLLGMISPVAVKLAVRDLDSTGRVVGRLYAISTVGSIAGTFATGFFFIARFGTRATLLGVAVALILTALLLGGLLRRTGQIAVLATVLFIGGYQLMSPRTLAPPLKGLLEGDQAVGTIHTEESQYYTIRVERTVRADNGAAMNALHLDHLTHSFSDPRDPSHLEYGYLEIFREVIRWKAWRGEESRLLFLGGGGYTLPRLTTQTFPSVDIDVVEIDPAVTRVARNFMGLPESSSITTFNEDARWHSMRSRQTYDAIFLDVFNDLSVPYHLTTAEFTGELKRLAAWDGVVVANVIDNYERGRFLPSYIRTLQSVFGKQNVALILESEEDAADVSSTYVVVASASLDRLLDFLYAAPTFDGLVVPPDGLQKYLARGRGIVLTDDHAPVDNMLAARFEEQYTGE
jgi:predicted membrane-bound spermidine synthase